MTSKEIEARSGIPRANIRYYEAEGLLHPVRGKNGYRDYREEDLADLRRVQLLRRLGVSIGELRALSGGQAALPPILDARLAALEREQREVEGLRRVCLRLREQGQDFAGLDPEPFLSALDSETAAPAVPEADALPTVCSLPRRFLARMIDYVLCRTVLVLALALTGNNANTWGGAGTLAMTLLTLVLQSGLEAACLHWFAATPGKALLGLRLRGPDGENLTFTAAWERYVRILCEGMGFGIPILNLVMLYQSAKRSLAGEAQPWDAETAYTASSSPAKCAAAVAAAAAAYIGVNMVISGAASLPPNRGELTVAEFAENFNRQASFLGADLACTLDETGAWTEAPNTITIGGEWGGEKPEFHYTVNDGVVTGVTLAGRTDGTEEWVSLPGSEMLAAVTAFSWAGKETPLLTSRRMGPVEALASAIDEARDYQAELCGTTVSLKIEQRGFYAGGGWLLPIEELPAGETPCCAFTFSITRP